LAGQCDWFVWQAVEVHFCQVSVMNIWYKITLLITSETPVVWLLIQKTSRGQREHINLNSFWLLSAAGNQLSASDHHTVWSQPCDNINSWKPSNQLGCYIVTMFLFLHCHNIWIDIFLRFLEVYHGELLTSMSTLWSVFNVKKTDKTAGGASICYAYIYLIRIFSNTNKYRVNFI